MRKLLAPKIHRVGGVDCSTHSFAYSIFEDNEPVDCGEIWFEGKDLLDRLASAQKLIQAAVDDGRLRVDAMAFEAAIQVGNNRQTGIHLAYCYGAVLGPLLNAGVKVKLVTPTQWQPLFGYKKMTAAEKTQMKLEVPGKSINWYKEEERRRRKAQIMTIAEKYFPGKIETDNIGDAVGVNSWGLSYFAVA